MFKRNFERICFEKHLSPSSVCEAIGLNRSSYSNWNDLSVPRKSTLQKLSDYLGVTVDALIGDNYTPPPDIRNIEPLPQSRRLPLVGTIACGEPILAEQNIERYISCPDTISADFVLRCKGDSMVGARIQDGDLVFIRSQPDVDNGQIAAVMIDGEATLKRVYKYPGKLVLYPENPRYEPLLFTGPELLNIRILGLAVAFTSVL